METKTFSQKINEISDIVSVNLNGSDSQMVLPLHNGSLKPAVFSKGKMVYPQEATDTERAFATKELVRRAGANPDGTVNDIKGELERNIGETVRRLSLEVSAWQAVVRLAAKGEQHPATCIGESLDEAFARLVVESILNSMIKTSA